ncbi:MAG TPA: DoxX family protein [Chitinophagaceae bacterium]|nr:DoxX family protein [Chitinophagaceae bacterium]
MSISLSISTIAPWVLRIIAAVIMLQTLYFKFSGSEESVYIFSQLGMEPWGRMATGILELIASILILYPKTTFFGSVLAIGLMLGAVGAHLTKLGIEVKNDGGQLFIYGLLVLLSSFILAIIYRIDGINLIKRIL